jgi:hypothetical protein
VDPDARHGHKTAARRFDGYKGHIAIDPDAEIVTATVVTPGNRGDAAAMGELLADDFAARSAGEERDQPGSAGLEPAEAETAVGEEPLIVYGDAAYGAGEALDLLAQQGAVSRCKVQPPVAPAGRFAKDAFAIDLEQGVVTCPAGQTVPLTPQGAGHIARFGLACATCALAERCTTGRTGRTISVGPYEAQLSAARAAQTDPAWRADYRATRPKVERKLAHLVRRRHGGRRARVRGRLKVAADFALLAAAANLARFARLGLSSGRDRWAILGT